MKEHDPPVSELDREQLRERVAAGVATGEERDRLASMLARAIRERDDDEFEAIEALIDELRVLASAGSDRTSCTDALAGALLDAQIRAFERRDAADAWRRLDELRARLLDGGTPDLLHDRLAAALYNMVRGGELLGDEPMRLAGLHELRMRAFDDPSAGACRVALAELLADSVATAVRDGSLERATRAIDELEQLRALEPSGVALGREYARALTEQVAFEPDTAIIEASLQRLIELAATFEQANGDPIRLHLARALVSAHARALREGKVDQAAALRERLRELEQIVAAAGGRTRARTRAALVRELGSALSQTVFAGREHGAEREYEQALAELRGLVRVHDTDLELRGLWMSALFWAHHNALARNDDDEAEDLQVEADRLREHDDAFAVEDTAVVDPRPRRNGLLHGGTEQRTRRVTRLRADLRVTYMQLLLAAHARAGDRGDWARAAQLLARARTLVDHDLITAPPKAEWVLASVETFGQMLVNAHVDAGVGLPGESREDRQARARGLLDELRELADAHPRSVALQLHHATTLFNAHVDAGRRHALNEADELLAALEERCAAHAEQLELRRRLAMALVNHHGDLLEREDFGRAASVLDRLRALARAVDADDQLRVQLAMGLGNALAHIDDPVATVQGQRLIAELRVLAAHPDASETLRALVLDELSELFAPRQ